MRSTKAWLLGALLVTATALAGCGTAMRQAPSGFLTDYDGLQPMADWGARSRAAASAVDPKRVRVAAVEWRVTDDKRFDAIDQAAMKERLRESLQLAVRRLPAATSGGRAVVIRAAITRVETVSVGFNTMATVMLIGPLDRGGAAVEIEAIDAESREQLAALTLGYFAPFTDVGARYRRLAPAAIALDKAAEEFGALLQPRS